MLCLGMEIEWEFVDESVVSLVNAFANLRLHDDGILEPSASLLYGLSFSSFLIVSLFVCSNFAAPAPRVTVSETIVAPPPPAQSPAQIPTQTKVSAASQSIPPVHASAPVQNISSVSSSVSKIVSSAKSKDLAVLFLASKFDHAVHGIFSCPL